MDIGQKPEEHEGYLGHSLDSITTPSASVFQKQGCQTWVTPLVLQVYGLPLGI